MSKQTIAKAAAAIIVLMILFPPWSSGQHKLGYSPIWSEPPVYPPRELGGYSERYRGTVDTPLLLGQIIVALAAAGLAMFAFRKD